MLAGAPDVRAGMVRALNAEETMRSLMTPSGGLLLVLTSVALAAGCGGHTTNKTTTFKLSPAQVAGADMVRFVAVPLAGGGELARTEPVHVSPKDVVVLDIPPP